MSTTRERERESERGGGRERERGGEGEREVSYMEIYNEKVHDLLDPKG